LSLNTQQIQQQEFFLNPSSLSEYTDSLYNSLSVSFLCLSTTCLYLLSSVALKPIYIVCSFLLLGLSSFLTFIRLNPPLSISNNYEMLPGMAATCSVMERVIDAFEIPKMVFSIYTEKNGKICQNTIHRTSNILNPPYNSYLVHLYIDSASPLLIWEIQIQHLCFISGGPFVRGLTTRSGWFSLSLAWTCGSHCTRSGKARPKPLTTYVPPEIPLVFFCIEKYIKH